MLTDFEYKFIFVWRLAVGLLGLVILLSGCSIITDADRGLAERALHDSTGCVYVQGQGGAGAGAPGIPLAGGYGQGSLVVARSNRDDAKVYCGPEGARVE
jgi:hypothetical protein